VGCRGSAIRGDEFKVVAGVGVGENRARRVRDVGACAEEEEEGGSDRVEFHKRRYRGQKEAAPPGEERGREFVVSGRDGQRFSLVHLNRRTGMCIPHPLDSGCQRILR